METSQRPHVIEELATDPNPEVEAFLDAVKAAQALYLETIRLAHSRLADQGQLAHVAATQGRLTRQLFDAQRSILVRRAEIDAEVARIGTQAVQAADDIVAAAREAAANESTAAGRAGELDLASLSLPSDVSSDLLDDGPRSLRQQVAALGVAVVRTMEEADAVAQVIDDAFEPDEPDWVLAERELAALLDQWWARQNQEGGAVIDDAHARAAVRRHVAGIEAGELLAAAREQALEQARQAAAGLELDERTEPAEECARVEQPEPVLAPLPSQIPDRLAAALEAAGTDGLQSLLTELAESLQPVPGTDPVLPVRDGDVIIRLDPVHGGTPLGGAPADSFQHFWEHEHVPPAPTPERPWFPSHIVLPVTALTSALALLMAWIG